MDSPARGATAITAKDVAREAGVHPSTVSRSLNPSQASRVRQSTRERVIEVANRLSYHPDFSAASLRRQRTWTVGILIPTFGNPIYAELIHGVNKELESRGYQSLIIETPDGGDNLLPALRTLRARRVDGVICASARVLDGPILQAVADSGLPIVLALRWIQGVDLARVTNHDSYGGSLAAEHLVSLGHKKIIEIQGPEDIETFKDRSMGFREALARHSLAVINDSDVALTPSVEEGYRLMSELIRSGVADESTAVFAHNDSMAVGAIAALRESGRKTPEDVSVVGYNDDPLMAHLDPPLTTIRMSVVELGEIAARKLIQAIDGATEHDASYPSLPKLVVRASTAQVLKTRV